MKDKKKRELNYKGMFIAGILFITLGVVFSSQQNGLLGLSFIILGGAYLVAGLKNKDKWKDK
jgi:hypothetical protein